MVELHKVKITVLKRFDPKEVFAVPPATHVEPFGVCSRFREGQEFVVENMKMPEGFCGSAWNSIYCSYRLLAFGGDFPFIEEKGVIINCCVDGLRPVIFKLERI